MSNAITLADLVREWHKQAAAADAERDLRWPGDVPFDGGEEEAWAAELTMRACTFRQCAGDLAAIAYDLNMLHAIPL